MCAPLACFGQGVVRLQTIAASTQIGGGSRREFVARGEEQLRPEALKQRSPALVAGQCRSERTDALRRDDRNQPRLARQGKGPLVACGIRFSDRREGVVLVADEQEIAPDVRSGCAAILGMRWRTARWKSSFSITPRARARPGFRPTGKFSARTWPDSSSSSSGGSGRGSPGFGGVGVRASRRTKRAVDGRVLVEQREEHDDAFGDGGTQPVIEPTPAVRRTSGRRRRAGVCARSTPSLSRVALRTERRARAGRFQLGVVLVRHVIRAIWEPVRPRASRDLKLVVRHGHDDHFRRLSRTWLSAC